MTTERFLRNEKSLHRKPTITTHYMSIKQYQQSIKVWIHYECSLCFPRLLRKPSVALQTHQLPALAFCAG